MPGIAIRALQPQPGIARAFTLQDQSWGAKTTVRLLQIVFTDSDMKESDKE